MSEQSVALNTIKVEHDGKAVTVGGAINEMREITTKNGQKMAFVKIADQFGELELVLFPSIYQQTTGIWERDKVAARILPIRRIGRSASPACRCSLDWRARRRSMQSANH